MSANEKPTPPAPEPAEQEPIVEALAMDPSQVELPASADSKISPEEDITQQAVDTFTSIENALKACPSSGGSQHVKNDSAVFYKPYSVSAQKRRAAGTTVNTQGLADSPASHPNWSAMKDDNPHAEFDKNPFNEREYGLPVGTYPHDYSSFSYTPGSDKLASASQSSDRRNGKSSTTNATSIDPRTPPNKYSSPMPVHMSPLMTIPGGRLIGKAHPSRPDLKLGILAEEDMPDGDLCDSSFQFGGCSYVSPDYWHRFTRADFGGPTNTPPSRKPLRLPQAKQVSFVTESAPAILNNTTFLEPNVRDYGSASTYRPPPTPHPRSSRHRQPGWSCTSVLALLLATTALLMGMWVVATWEHPDPDMDLAPLHRVHYALAASLPGSLARRSIAGKLDTASTASDVASAARDLRGFDDSLAGVAHRVAVIGAHAVAIRPEGGWWRRVDARGTVMGEFVKFVLGEVQEIRERGEVAIGSLGRAGEVQHQYEGWRWWVRAVLGLPLVDDEPVVKGLVDEARDEVESVLDRFESPQEVLAEQSAWGDGVTRLASQVRDLACLVGEQRRAVRVQQQQGVLRG